MEQKRLFVERRKHERRNLYCLIKLRNEHVVTSLRNISGGGILFRISTHIPVGTLLTAEINLPVVNKIINAILEIVRIEKVKKMHKYLIGSKFHEIKDEDRKAIVDLVEATKEALR